MTAIDSFWIDLHGCMLTLILYRVCSDRCKRRVAHKDLQSIVDSTKSCTLDSSNLPVVNDSNNLGSVESSALAVSGALAESSATTDEPTAEIGVVEF